MLLFALSFVLAFVLLKFGPRPYWTVRMKARTQAPRQDLMAWYWRVRRKLEAKTRKAREHALLEERAWHEAGRCDEPTCSSHSSF